MAERTRPPVDEWRQEARRWLEDNAEPRKAPTPGELEWGVGEFSVAVFHNHAESEQREMLEAAAAWQQKKCDAGYGNITWPENYGGAGLSRAHERAFLAEEAAFETPEADELFAVTVTLIGPTIARHGSEFLKERFVRSLLRTEEYACQLFSEPSAGSDLASLGTKAERDGDEWVLNGQKVWTSGARFAHWGELIARTDPSVPKHAGMTAFMVPLDAPGVEIRPIRQMSGGASFNEVFFSDVRIPDGYRLGEIGEGWKVALTTLGFERGGSSGGSGGGKVGGSWTQVLALARHLERTDDPVIRQQLAELFTSFRLLRWNAQRTTAALRAGQTPGPEGSIGKLAWTANMTRTSGVVTSLLGPKLIADSGEWGTYEWGEHVLGAPGYRIAGGSDEIQRNIIGERVLGLAAEPRVDRDVPFSAAVR
jgi:alkylation response protein AidB-like acyl-CoA dehydrogenase